MATQPLPLVVHTTITHHIRTVEKELFRNRVAFALFKQRGQIKYNCSGKDQDWRVQYKRPASTGYADMQTVDYAPHERFFVPALDWRARLATDALSVMQQMLNSGPEAIVDLVSVIVPDLVDSLMDGLSSDLFRDGNAAANLKLPAGLESFFGAANSAAGNKISTPNDTYADHNTNLGDKGGTWSADLSSFPNATLARDYPDGQGDYEYDCYSPMLVNWSSTAWGTGLTTFRANAEYALGQALTWNQSKGGKDGTTDLMLTTATLFNEYKNAQRARQQINVQPTSSPLWKLGFKDIMNQDGVDITSDYDVPANTLYGLNFKHMRMDVLKHVGGGTTKQLFWTMKPWWDARSLMDLFAIGFFGNFRFRPKHQWKAKNFA